MLYIIQPKTNPTASLMSLNSVQVTQEFRKERLPQFTNQWQKDEGYKKIKTWVSKAKANKIVRAATNPEIPGITGTLVIDIDEEHFNEMEQELRPYANIVADEPMNLIEPDRKALSRKDKIEPGDLWHLEAIGLTEARNKGFGYTGRGVTIAVLDTGIDDTHPELQRKVVKSYNLDAKTFERFGEADEADHSIDTHGHGTHVAGLICGNNVGVAPEAKLVNGIIIPQGTGSLSSFVMSMNWISNRPEIDIVNISAGQLGTQGLKVVEPSVQTLLAAGILPVCAIGNEGPDHTRTPGNCRDTVSVGATTRSSRVAAFSSSGTIIFDNHQYKVPNLVAPGDEVYSCVMGGHYEPWSGTSMAAPIVSGMAALILQKYSKITVMDLKETLLEKWYKFLKGVFQDRQGAGLVYIPQDVEKTT